MTTPPTCPLCPRMRRNERPLCNNHIRKVGDQVIDRYFVRAKAAKMNPNDPAAAGRLVEVIGQMVHNATQFELIKKAGYRPFWNADRQLWEHPRDRAYEILFQRLVADPRHGGNQPIQTHGTIKALADELFPREPR